MTQPPSDPPQSARPALPSTASPRFAAFARFIIRHRFLVLFGNVLITAWFLSWVPQMKVDTSYKAMQVIDSEGQRVQDLLEASFGMEAGHFMIVHGDVFSVGYLEKLKAFHAELASIELDLPSLGKHDVPEEMARQHAEQAASQDGFGDFGDDEGWGDEQGGTVVEEVISMVTARDTTFGEAGLSVKGLLEDRPLRPQDMASLRAYALAQPSLAGRLIARNGEYSLMVLRTDFLDMVDQGRVDHEIRRLGAKYEGDDFQVQYSGTAAIDAEFLHYMGGSMALCYSLSLMLMVLLLVWTFRHVIGVVAPMLVVVQSVIWVIGCQAMSGTPMTLITMILPNFLTCVGIGDSVHIMSTYRAARARGLECDEAIVDAISHTGRPVVFTSVTTAVGLLSFLFADLAAIADLGIFGAIGVMVAMVQSLVLVPVLLTFAPKSRFGARPLDLETGIPDSMAGRFLTFCVGLSAPSGDRDDDMRARNRVLFAAAAVVVFGIFGASTLRVFYDPIAWLPTEAETPRAFAVMDEHLGGSGRFTLLVEPASDRGMRDQDVVDRLQRLERYVLAYEDENGRSITQTTSGILDIVRDTWWALNGKQPDGYGIPDSARGISDTLTMFESSGPEFLKRVTTVDGSASRVDISMLSAPSSEYIPLLRYIEEGIDDIVGDSAQVRVTGFMRQMVESDFAVVSDMIRSFLIALGFITLLMVWMLGEVRLGLIAMVPNLLPLVVVAGYMAVMGISIDMSNLVIASIGIGIAVDDTIHFLHHFRVAYVATGDREHAISDAAARAGISIINTSVVLFGGFIVFSFADLSNLIIFGELISVTVVAALLIDLIFAPALLRLAYPAHAPVAAAAA